MQLLCNRLYFLHSKFKCVLWWNVKSHHFFVIVKTLHILLKIKKEWNLKMSQNIRNAANSFISNSLVYLLSKLKYFANFFFWVPSKGAPGYDRYYNQHWYQLSANIGNHQFQYQLIQNSIYIYRPIRCFCYVLSECQKVRNSHILLEQNGGLG